MSANGAFPGRRPGLSGLLIGLVTVLATQGATYHIDPLQGDDRFDGTTAARAWRSLEKMESVHLQPGDEVRLARGSTHQGQLRLVGVVGTAAAPVVVSSYAASAGDTSGPALIDGRGTSAALLLKNCSHVTVTDLSLTADGGGWTKRSGAKPEMRCGLLVEVTESGKYAGIELRGLQVRNISFEEPGHGRPEEDVRTPNGKVAYGWGIRALVRGKDAELSGLSVKDCVIERVDHTGLKLTGPTGSLRDVRVEGVRVTDVGGPGVQMSGVIGGHFSHLLVDGSGSTRDPRNWGRGSGLWTWGSSNVVIERSRFLNAKGPGDSAGVHIDFNCSDVIVQYNLSANNAGGFCEILGNNRNCAYRYNVSVNDGWRVKGKDGAFQEGKIFWLSGYVGQGARSGPFNTYFYNNTVYVGEEIEAKVAVAPTADGVLIANNIFCFRGRSRLVAGDQQSADQKGSAEIKRVVFAGNMFLRADNWPADLGLQDREPIYSDPQFRRPGGGNLEDYTPTNTALVKDRGIEIPLLPDDDVGLRVGREVKTDILGHPISGAPDLGAIELP